MTLPSVIAAEIHVHGRKLGLGSCSTGAHRKQQYVCSESSFACRSGSTGCCTNPEMFRWRWKEIDWGRTTLIIPYVFRSFPAATYSRIPPSSKRFRVRIGHVCTTEKFVVAHREIACSWQMQVSKMARPGFSSDSVQTCPDCPSPPSVSLISRLCISNRAIKQPDPRGDGCCLSAPVALSDRMIWTAALASTETPRERS